MQTFENWELIAVNDGSQDSTAALLDHAAAEDPRIKVTHLQTNGGVSSARNLGLELAAASYVSFLDADDIYMGKQSLLDRMQALETAEATHEGVFCRTVICNEAFEPLGPEMRGQPVLSFDHILVSPAHINSLIVSREFIGDQRFETDRKNGEDWVFLSRLLRRGGTLKRVDTDPVSYRWWQGSVTNRDFIRHEVALKPVIKLFLSEDEGCLGSAPEWRHGLAGQSFDAIWARRRVWSFIYLLLSCDWAGADRVIPELLNLTPQTLGEPGIGTLEYPAVRFFHKSGQEAQLLALEHYAAHQLHWNDLLDKVGLKKLANDLSNRLSVPRSLAHQASGENAKTAKVV